MSHLPEIVPTENKDVCQRCYSLLDEGPEGGKYNDPWCWHCSTYTHLPKAPKLRSVWVRTSKVSFTREISVARLLPSGWIEGLEDGEKAQWEPWPIRPHR
jgi:hypothetical protein